MWLNAPQSVNDNGEMSRSKEKCKHMVGGRDKNKSVLNLNQWVKDTQLLDYLRRPIGGTNVLKRHDADWYVAATSIDSPSGDSFTLSTWGQEFGPGRINGMPKYWFSQ
uniref:Uncharacterized protein n=1 Tax=Trypanosoma vivax (strain Y486) TaxID=1055687 RepID=G0UA84_TRYVY|nr:hypothetical protein, unlikely [Trypanosoma vivax Y486]